VGSRFALPRQQRIERRRHHRGSSKGAMSSLAIQMSALGQRTTLAGLHRTRDGSLSESARLLLASVRNRGQGTRVGCMLVRSAWVGPLLLCVVLAGCGSSESAPSGTTGSEGASGQPAQTTQDPTPTGPSYSETVIFKRDEFSFRLATTIQLGQPSTNTTELAPPDENVAIPVSGTASLTNETTGYTASATDIPNLAVFAIYNAPSCFGTQLEGPNGGTEMWCGVEIASIASACNGSDQAVASIDGGETANLAIWPSDQALPPDEPSLETSEANSGPVYCQVVLTGAAAGEEAGGHPAPTPNAELKGLDPSNSAAAGAALSKDPAHWLIVTRNGACSERGPEWIEVIAAKPAGIKGCLDEPRRHPL
jgi:hypothetical protein